VLCANVQIFSIDRGSINGHSLRGKRFVLIGLPRKPFGLPSPRRVLIENQADKQVVLDLIQKLFGSAQGDEVVITKLSSKIRDHRQQLRSETLAYDVQTVLPETPPDSQVNDHLYGWLVRPRQGVVNKVYVRWSDGELSYAGTNSVFADIRD
jgi:hypothetical protein